MARKSLNKKKVRQLMEAIKQNLFEEVVSLIEGGFDINAFFDNGRTPLMAAASNHNKQMVEFFLQHGSDVRAKNTNERDALYFAIGPDYSSWSQSAKDADQEGTIKALLQKGAACQKIHIMILLISYDEEMIQFFKRYWRQAPGRDVVDKAIAEARSCYTYEGNVSEAEFKNNIAVLLSCL